MLLFFLAVSISTAEIDTIIFLHETRFIVTIFLE